MSVEYRLRRRARACMACENEFADNAVIVSAIYEDGEGFTRRDVCEACFDAGQEAYSVWRSRQPPQPEARHTVDFDLALSFFARLAREADPAREGLVYVLALLLTRKRRLKITATHALPDGELLTVVLPGAEEDETVQIRAPRLDAESVAGIQAELAALLGIVDPSADAVEDDADEPSPAPEGADAAS